MILKHVYLFFDELTSDNIGAAIGAINIITSLLLRIVSLCKLQKINVILGDVFCQVF